MVKRKTKKDNFNSRILLFLLAVVVIAILAYLISDELNRSRAKKPVANVNGEGITQSELDMEYLRLPEEYQSLISKEELLNQLIDKKLLLQEAGKLNIKATDAEIDESFNKLKAQFADEQEFKTVMDEQQYSLEELRVRVEEQIIITRLINETVFSQIEISEADAMAYYNANKEIFLDQDGARMSFSESREFINSILARVKSADFLKEYVEKLRENAEIEYAEKVELNPFSLTGDSLCLVDSKPVIRVYSSSKCLPCREAEPALAAALNDFDFTVFRWELDTGDNLATDEIETTLSKEEYEILKQYNPDFAVPFYLFGCKFHRTGNAFPVVDLALEEQTFKEIFQDLE